MSIIDEGTKKVQDAIDQGKKDIAAFVEEAKTDILEFAKKVNTAADAKADKGLDWLKASKWTGAILLAGALVFLFFVYK